MPPRLKAFFLLALAVIHTAFRRLFGRRRNGLQAFRAHYAADGLSSVSSEQRGAMTGFGRCVACGLCDRGEGERIARSRGAYSGVMELMLAASRSMPDYAASARVFAHVPDAALEEKERICPARVPMVAIARFVREKAAEARISLPIAPPAPALPRDTGEI